MTRLRVRANLVAVAVVSASLLGYAARQLITDFVLDDTYRLFVDLPNASGLVANKEVTYNGYPIGFVRDVEVSGTGARVELAVERKHRVPADIDIVVLRRSALGEQALDIRPRGPLEGGDFYGPGDTLEYAGLTLPPEVSELFATAAGVFEPIDKDQAGALVGELADIVRGRRDDFRSILRDGADFSAAVADNGSDYDRFFDSGRVVNAQLAASRETIGGLVGELRDATSVLTDMRGELEGLLVEAPPTITLAADFVEGGQADISCTFDYLANLSERTARPHNLDNIGEALRYNRYFFHGFDIITPVDHTGRGWARVHMLPPGGPVPVTYLPEKRPIRQVLPGGGCRSPFGPGAPPATQKGHTPVSVETRMAEPAGARP